MLAASITECRCSFWIVQEGRIWSQDKERKEGRRAEGYERKDMEGRKTVVVG
jgi:hypothetical protein